MRQQVVAAFACATVFAAGCGGDDGGGAEVSEDAQPYVDAMIASFENDPDAFDMERDQTECLAGTWLTILTPERLEEAGITPEMLAEDEDSIDFTEVGLSEDEGNDLYDAFDECGTPLQELFVEEIAQDEDLSEEDRECLTDAFSDDLLRRFVVTSMIEGEEAVEDDDELMGLFFGVMASCLGAMNLDE